MGTAPMGARICRTNCCGCTRRNVQGDYGKIGEYYEPNDFMLVYGGHGFEEIQKKWFNRTPKRKLSGTCGCSAFMTARRIALCTGRAGTDPAFVTTATMGRTALTRAARETFATMTRRASSTARTVAPRRTSSQA